MLFGSTDLASKRSLRLLVVGINWPPETFIQRKLEGLVAEGVNVIVVARVPPEQSKFRLRGVRMIYLHRWDDPLNLKILRFLQLLRGGLMLLLKDPRRWLLAIEALRRPAIWEPYQRWARLRYYLPALGLRPDIVHFEWNSWAIRYLPLFTAWQAPVVISCRGGMINVYPHTRGYEWLIRGMHETFPQATAVHCVSETIRNEATKYGLDARKAVVIRPAVDPAFFRPAAHQPPHAEFRIITTGNLDWVKGHEYALAAVRQLVDRGVAARLDIIGDGPERQRLLYTIADLGLDGCVHLHGRLTPEAVRARLQAADVFVLTSVSEGISNAVLEAMACGLAVVVTESGGMREAVADGVEGLVVGVRDAVGVAEALGELAGDGERRAVMGRAGRARVEREFGLAGQVAQFVHLYQAVVQEYSRRSDHRTN